MDTYNNAKDADARVDGLWATIAGSRRTSVDIKTLRWDLQAYDIALKAC
jgi:hypothetical protein